MAAVTELCFLLLVLISNIHTEELISVKYEGDYYEFTPPSEASHCLISRFDGEEKFVLWNISDLWTGNSTAPEHLKQRLSVVRNNRDVSSYWINNLIYSDSGLYQEKCWTEGTETHERNIRIIVCGSKYGGDNVYVEPGQTVNLPCEGASDNLTHLWLKRKRFDPDETWTRVFVDSSTSVTDDNKGRIQEIKNTSTLQINNFKISDFLMYNCLMMNQNQCVSSDIVFLDTETEYLVYTVEDTVALQCPFSDSHLPVWMKIHFDRKDFGQNQSLIISPVRLDHSGLYMCQIFDFVQYYKYYMLFVCPEIGPSVVQLFSEGENVTLTWGNSWTIGIEVYWFMKSEQTNGKNVHVHNWYKSSHFTFDSNKNLIISNVSVKHTGEFWCVVTYPGYRCFSTMRYVLKSRDL